VSRAQQHVRSTRSRSTRSTDLRVVRRKKRGLIKRGRSRRIAPALVLLGILIFATIGTILLEQVVLAQSAFELAAIRKQVEVAEEQHSQLLLQAAKLGSSERIKRVALEDLGMVYPEDAGGVQVITADVHSTWSTRLADSTNGKAARAAADSISAEDTILGAGSP
jgi:cell division protein FtsL